jgi:hypothetical protein
VSLLDPSAVLPADWDHHGYDMVPKTYWIYAFVSTDGRRAKVGLVGREERLNLRLIEVRRNCEEPGLELMAAVSIEGLTQPEAEDAEAALRLWLTRSGGLAHYPRTDWLAVPDGQQVDWQELLQSGRDAVMAWGREQSA